MQAQLRVSGGGVEVTHSEEQQPLPEQPPQALTGELVWCQLRLGLGADGPGGTYDGEHWA